ncbi:uncharacterized protein [Misgurnus anguillicaudatus]|uniref:uncharacterized protein isoform X1 n=2 Tax=Misgurnus anguillicaudatus TaxID=75329 RepID=UPI003CCFC7CB
MAYSKIRELYERHFTSVLYDREKVLKIDSCSSEEKLKHNDYYDEYRRLSDAQCYSDQMMICTGEKLHMERQETLYTHNTHEDSPAGQQLDFRSYARRSSLSSDHYSPSRSDSIFIQNQKLFPDLSSIASDESLHTEKHNHLTGGSEDASANKMFFSDLDEIPGLDGELEEPVETPEEDWAEAITAKVLDMKQLYKQDCETFGLVVKMLIYKDQTLEQKLLMTMKKILIDLKKENLLELQCFISDVTAPLKPEEIIKLYQKITSS